MNIKDLIEFLKPYENQEDVEIVTQVIDPITKEESWVPVEVRISMTKVWIFPKRRL